MMLSPNLPILSFAIWCPIFFGLLILIVGHNKNTRFIRCLSLFGALVSFAATLPVLLNFDKQAHGMQFVEKASWIERFQVEYFLGVDGISLWLVILTAFITCIVVIAGWEVIQTHVAQYMSAFLLLSGMTIGAFCALDGMLFYVFFEATLIPMFIIIGVWGGENRIYAAFKFFLYTLFGSLPMLVAMLYLYLESNSFSILAWHALLLPLDVQIMVFIAFLLAFAVKIPMWPLHTWLPDAHVEAPTGGSVVLAAIMLKLGAYGFVRLLMPVTPDASRQLSGLILTLSLIAIIYMGLVALMQKDMKKLVAYSSIAHMGFVTLGFFLFTNMGIEGGLVQMISHGFVSAAMFLCVGVLYDRMHSREIADYGGAIHKMPRFAALFVLFAMANCGLPGTSGFVGEFMIIMGAVASNFWLGLLTASTLVLGAAYSLWLVRRVVFGPIKNEQVANLPDLNKREFFLLALLAFITIFIGVYPVMLIDTMHTSVTDLLIHFSQSKI